MNIRKDRTKIEITGSTEDSTARRLRRIEAERELLAALDVYRRKLHTLAAVSLDYGETRDLLFAAMGAEGIFDGIQPDGSSVVSCHLALTSAYGESVATQGADDYHLARKVGRSISSGEGF